MAKATKQSRYQQRRVRTRARISGTAIRPRLSVRRSLKYIYVELIDDERGVTLAAASDLTLSKNKEGGKVGSAEAVGVLLAEKAKAAGIETAVFDRGGRAFHGRVKAVAIGARKAGLKI